MSETAVPMPDELTDEHLKAIMARAENAHNQGADYHGDAWGVLLLAVEVRRLRLRINVLNEDIRLEKLDYLMLQSIAQQDADVRGGTRVSQWVEQYIKRLITALRPFTCWTDVRLDDRGRAIAKAEALVKAWDERHG